MPQQNKPSSTLQNKQKYQQEIDRITIFDAPEEPVVEPTTSPVIEEQAAEVKTQSAETDTAENQQLNLK